MKGPYEHDHGRYTCPACAWDKGAKAGVELAKERLRIERSRHEFVGLDWSDVDFILEWKE